jgi:mono/diheme cytochrome c family protein
MASPAAGEALYLQHCSACHQADGAGIPGFAPPLANALAVHLRSARGAEYLAQVVVAGLAGPIAASGQTFNSAMASLAQLSDGDIAAILNYVVRGLNQASEDRVSAGDVALVRARKPGPGDTLRLRRSLLGG